MIRRRRYVGFAVALSLVPAAAAAAQPDDLCRDPSLTRQERDLCIEQIRHAQTLAERKAIQAKFRKRIAERGKK